MGVSAEFQAHLTSGLTTLARCWRVERKDGVVLGFTDHDRVLRFENVDFEPGSGLTAFSLEQGSGLGVDNTEALGVLSHDGINEADIAARRFDGAEVTCWLVNWASLDQRQVLFAGQIGEVSRSGGGFRAELRGLTEALNQPMGRVYQKPCTAVLGDQHCRFDLGAPEFSSAFTVVGEEGQERFVLSGAQTFDQGWFKHGLMVDEARGLVGFVKADEVTSEQRRVTLWAPMAEPLIVGNIVNLVAGCDKQFSTCRFKFSNQLNFRGFPDVPGDEWITRLPRQDGVNSGGSLR